jgi:hypothetical protein
MAASAGQAVTSMERGGVTCSLRSEDSAGVTISDMWNSPTSVNPCGVGAMNVAGLVPDSRNGTE